MSFNEFTLEDHFLKKLIGKGWKYVPGSELERDNLDEPLLLNNLIKSIEKINDDKELEEEDINQVLNELKFKGSGIEGVRKILNFYKHGISIKSRRGRVIKRVNLFDYDNIENNEFIVSNQVIYHGAREIRVDLILFVNGIPLVNIELKNPASFSQTWYDAYKQIKNYEQSIPELYKYVQIGVAAEQIAKYFPIIPWQNEVKTYEWKFKPSNEEKPLNSMDSIIEFLSRDTILNIIRNYLFFREEFGSETKVIARYMQYRASEKIVSRVLRHSEGKGEKNKGLIWHWQGSGKTLTTIFAAIKLYYLSKLENPTIFLIEDRKDLQDQLFNEFNNLDVIEPEKVDSGNKLKDLLKHDNWRGKRGIFILMIHKFAHVNLESFYDELKNLSKEKETLMNRKNVFVFLDEAHRTEYGTIAGQMEVILKSAYFFAFTGTPIAKRERNTFSKFSYLPDELYLDRYFVNESIDDGFTLKILYQPRLEKFHLKKQELESLMEIEFEDLDEKIKEGVINKLNAINVVLENENRIGPICEDIAQHFKENVNGKFKAMIATASRKACVLYKKHLDKHLPSEWSEIIMSYNKDDNSLIKEYQDGLRLRYNYKNTDDIKREILTKFKDENENPKILIVDEMLLTGFDAPILQTMYLDKPLREYRLLQAVARTNRPYKDLKEAGFIIDYTGIIDEELRKALELYSNTNIENVNEIIYDFESLKEDFNSLLEELFSYFKDISTDKYDMDILIRAVEILTSNQEIAEMFLENYRKLRRLFEFLGTTEEKILSLPEFKWLTAVYTYYLKVISRETESEDLIEKYYNKTLENVYKTTDFKNFEENLPIIDFNSNNYVDILDSEVKNKEEKAANIVFTLNKYVLVDINRKPAYETVADKVERILDSWKEKEKDFDNIYSEGAKIVQLINKEENRQNKLELSDMEYSILSVLENKFGKDESLIKDVKDLSLVLKNDIFEGWQSQNTVHKKVERNTRLFIRKKYFKDHQMTRDGLKELHDNIIEKVERYSE